MHFEGDGLPRGQRVVSAGRGTDRGLVRTAPVRIASALLLAAAAAPATACGGGSPASPTFSATNVSVSDDAGSFSDAAGSSIGGDASIEAIMAGFARCAASPATGSFPADVAAVIHSKCNPCHTDLPLNGAPFPLLTYADVHKLFAGTFPIYEEMYLLIQPNGVPHMPFGNAPQLTADEFKTLSDWLISCAPPG
jgi:hypothetical protein